jgi:hypothetical protein
MTQTTGPGAPAKSSSGGGRRGRRRSGANGSSGTGGSNGLILVGIASIAALVLAGAALFFELGRPSTSSDAECRTIAWRALPAADTLPAGWALSASGFYSDGYGASFAGPAASASPAAASAAVTLRISCFGADGHLALVRSRDGDLAAGGAEVPFADMGDEVVATQDANGSSTSVYIRRGPLVASIAASSGVDPADLEQAAQAVDDAMVAAQGSAGAGAAATVGPADSVGPAASDAGPTDAAASEDLGTDVPEAHDVPDLEALLPKTVAGATLTSQSTKGLSGLGDDSATQALVAKLKTLGATADQVEIAEAYDPNGTVDADIVAFRVKGIGAPALHDALTQSWLAAGASGVTTTQKTIAGRTVTVIDYGDGSSQDYVWEQGDSVIDLVTSDATIAEKVVASFK